MRDARFVGGSATSQMYTSQRHRVINRIARGKEGNRSGDREHLFLIKRYSPPTRAESLEESFFWNPRTPRVPGDDMVFSQKDSPSGRAFCTTKMHHKKFFAISLTLRTKNRNSDTKSIIAKLTMHGKNDFAEVFKNLARYKSENNFLERLSVNDAEKILIF